MGRPELQVRQRGYAVSDGQVTLDALTVGVLILAAADQVVAALSLVVHAEAAQPGTLAAGGAVTSQGTGHDLAARLLIMARC